MLYLNLYREHIVDLMLQKKELEAHRLYTDKVHHLIQYANAGCAVPSAVKEKVKEIFRINRNEGKYQPTENAKMCVRVSYYLRLYFPEVVGHDVLPGKAQCHLWQFVIMVPKKTQSQSNPCFRCLACGTKFTNCTISKYREHMTEKEEGKKGKKNKKGGKFPTCTMISLNMRLRYSIGESDDTQSSKPGRRNINIRRPQQDVAPSKNKSVLPQQASGKKRGIPDEGLEIDTLEQKRRAVAKGSNYQQEGSVFQYLVTGVHSNVAAFNKLFGNNGFTLAVQSDLSVAMDMLCKMTGTPGTQTEVAQASSDEATVAGDIVVHDDITESTVCEMSSIPCNRQERMIEEGDKIHEMAGVVRQSITFLFRYYRNETMSQKVQRELIAAKDLLSSMVPYQKK